MDVIWWVIIFTAIAGVGGTGIGGLFGLVLKKDSSKIVSLLLSFAAGIMLAVVCFDLITTSLEQDVPKNLGITITVLGIVIGYAVIYILNYVIDKNTNKEVKHIDDNHPKTADDLDELIHSDHLKAHKESNNKGQLFIAGIVMAFAIALHNLPEGMVIGASYSKVSSDVFSGSGLLVAIVIGLHNIPEGMAVAVPLIAGGMKKSKAIIMTALSGAPTILGAILGYYLGLLSPVWLSISLSFASGAMLYVVLGELLPESILMWKSKLPAFFTLVGLLVGLIIVIA